MAHDIYRNSAMMYVGEVPWHGLGVQLPANATWAECKEAVGFYTALERPLFYPGNPNPVPDRKALVASTDGRYLATVGADYGVVQFDDLADAVVKAAGDHGAVFHTAGLLGENGDRAWLLGELPGRPIQVPGDVSEIKRYFMATTAHDGAHAAQLMNCATRVVCRNTLGMALGEKDGARWSIRHTANAANRVRAAGESMRRLVVGYEKFGELAALLARTKINTDQEVSILSRIFPLEQGLGDKARLAQEGRRIEVARLMAGEMKGADGIMGTAWGAFQAVTEWIDHKRPVRALSSGDQSGARMASVLFGVGADLKRDALSAIRAVAL